MSKRLFTALLAAVVLFGLGTPCSKATMVVYDPTNFTTNTANYVSSVKSWTSDLANQLKGLQQYATQIQQFQQQIQQYATMLNYIGNPQALANAVGLGPVMQLGSQAQGLYSRFSNIQSLQGLTSATGALSNTMNGLYPAINPNNILNSQAFQKYQLLTNAGQQYQSIMDWNKQQQQQLAGSMNAAVQNLQSAPNETSQLRALGAIQAIDSAQRQAQAAAQDAVNTALVTQIEEQAMNEQMDDAAYQEAAKDYVAAQTNYFSGQVTSLEKLGSPQVTIPTPNAQVQNNGAQFNAVGVQPSSGGF